MSPTSHTHRGAACSPYRTWRMDLELGLKAVSVHGFLYLKKEHKTFLQKEIDF